MASRYYFLNSLYSGTCQFTGQASADNLALSTTEGGVGGEQTATTQSASFETWGGWSLDGLASTGSTGTYSNNINVTTADSGMTYRFLTRVNNSSCTAATGSPDTGPNQSGAGTYTDTTASITWGDDDKIQVEAQFLRDSGQHGNKTLGITYNDTTSYIDAPWNLPPTLTQVAVQLFNDDASSATADDHTAIADANVAVGFEGALPSTKRFWVRILVECSAFGPGTLGATLQQRRNGGSWTSNLTNDFVVCRASNITTNGTATQSRMGGSGTFVAGSMVSGTGLSNAADITLQSGEKTEVMFCCTWNTSTPQEDLFEFRLIGVNDETTLLDTYTSIGEVYSKCLAMAFREGQQPTSSYTGSSHTYIDEDSPDNNYGTNTELIADMDRPTGANPRTRTKFLLKDDISSITGSVTVLKVTIRGNVTNLSPDEFDAVEVTGSWTEGGATYNNTNSLLSTTVVGNLTFNATGVQSFDLNATGIALVQDWIDGVKTNNGIGITDLGDGNFNGLHWDSDDVATVANRPRLLILYITNTTAVDAISSARHRHVHRSY